MDMNFIRIQITGLFMLVFSLFPFPIADAQGPSIPVQIINVCNTGNVKFAFAVVKAEFNFFMPNEWRVRGWLHVPPGSCERADHRSSAAPYYLAFLQRDASNNPGIAVYKATGGEGYIHSSNRSFCVQVDVFDYKEEGEPTRDCPEPYMLAPFPIMISAAFGGTIETTLKIPASKDASLIYFPSKPPDESQICAKNWPGSIFSGQRNQKGRILCDCPSGMTWNNNQTACITAPPPSKAQHPIKKEDPPNQSVLQPPYIQEIPSQPKGTTIAQFDDFPLDKQEEFILSALKEQTSTRKEKECITAWFTTAGTSSLLPPVPDGRIEFDRNLEQPRKNNSQALLKDILELTIDWVEQNKCPLDKAFISLIDEAKKDDSLSVIAIPSPKNELGLSFLKKVGLVVYQNIYVESVDPDSILGKAGLEKGDRIHAVHPKEVIFTDRVGGEKVPDIGNFFGWYVLASESAIKKGKDKLENMTLGVIRDDKKITFNFPSFPILENEKLEEKFGKSVNGIELINYVLKGDFFPGVTLVGGPIFIMGFNYPSNASENAAFPTLETDILSGINGKDIISIAQLNHEKVWELFKFTDFVYLKFQNSSNNNYKVLKREIPK